MKHLKNLFIIIFFFCATINIFSKVDISEILKNVNKDSLISYIKDLTGERIVSINDYNYRIISRNYKSTTNNIAFYYLFNRLLEFGYQPIIDTINYNSMRYFNVNAIKIGTNKPNDYYILGGHFDSMSGDYTSSIGADDNATGCAIVLEAARVLAKQDLQTSVIFSFFNLEEAGLLGSNYMLNSMQSKQYNIKAMVNCDMIGYDGNNDNLFFYQQNSKINGNRNLVKSFQKVSSDYSININGYVNETTDYSSDHNTFWARLIPAVAFHEALNDKNPKYHTQNDILSNILLNYFFNISKLAIAGLAYILDNGITEIDRCEISSISRVFPNPARDYVIIESAEINHIEKVTITNSLGNIVYRTNNLNYVSNSVTINLSYLNLPAGVFFLKIEGSNKIEFKKMIVEGN